MRSRERRFMGKAQAWQIGCARCGTLSKRISPGARRALPPQIVIKKLVQTGWQVGDNSKDDLCPDCIRKPVKSRVEVAAKALHEMQAPMVPINGSQSVHFTELKVAASSLDTEQAKELIEVLRKQIPSKPPKQPKAEPPAKMAQSDYDNWLNELECKAD